MVITIIYVGCLGPGVLEITGEIPITRVFPTSGLPPVIIKVIDNTLRDPKFQYIYILKFGPRVVCLSVCVTG